MDKKKKNEEVVKEAVEEAKKAAEAEASETEAGAADEVKEECSEEKSSMYEIGDKDVIEKILPVVDNFERGFVTVSEEEKENPFVQGMDKVYKQLMTVLEGLGVKPIEALGQEFNPDLHHAVMHVEDEEAGENVIVEEFQKGYMYRDSVVRYSMVKVAN